MDLRVFGSFPGWLKTDASYGALRASFTDSFTPSGFVRVHFVAIIMPSLRDYIEKKSNIMRVGILYG